MTIEPDAQQRAIDAIIELNMHIGHVSHYLEQVATVLSAHFPASSFSYRLQSGERKVESCPFKRTPWGISKTLNVMDAKGMHTFELYALNSPEPSTQHLLPPLLLDTLTKLITQGLIIAYSKATLTRHKILLDAYTDLGLSAKVLIDKNGAIVDWNGSATALFGYTPEEAMGQNIFELLLPNHPTALLKAKFNPYRLIYHRESGSEPIELKLENKNGKKLYIDLRVKHIKIENQRYFLCVAQDITPVKILQKRLDRAQHIAHLGSWEHDFTNGQMWWSDELYRILGASKTQNRPELPHLLQHIHPEDRDYFNEAYQGAIATQKILRISHRILTPQGQVKHVFQQCVTHFNNNQPLYTEGVVLDVSDRVSARNQLLEIEEKLKLTGLIDPMTELPNRASLMNHLTEKLNAPHSNTQFALACLDIDKFKQINDALGHDVGDELLIAVSETLESISEGREFIARLASDEFAIVFESGQSQSMIAARMIDYLSAFQDPLYIQGHEINVSLSGGVTIQDDHIQDPLVLLQQTNAALYQAKTSGRGGVAFYNETIDAKLFRRHEMENQLRHAIEHHELSLVYQPKFSLQTGDTLGAEVLLRWDNPKFGLVGPDEFIPIAEESELIQSIGSWILQKVAEEYQMLLHKSLPEPFHIAINLSMVQLNDPFFIEKIKYLIQQEWFKPNNLLFELTETALMTYPSESIKLLKKISKQGVRLALDDFGMGYSSMRYIKTLPISALKIDKSFIRDMQDDPNDEAIVKAIIALGKSLHWTVTAEGVETESQLEILKHFGCDEAQGYLVAKPLTLNELMLFLESN